MLHRVMMVAAVLVLAIATSAAAQPAAPARTQSVGGGAEWVYPSRGGPITGSPGMTASWRRWFGEHVGVETAFGWWHKRLTRQFDYPSSQAPDGRVFPGLQGSSKTTFDAYSVGFNIVGRAPLGERVAIVAGAGPGFFVDRGAFEDRTNLYERVGTDASTNFGLQMVAELEVRAAERLSLVGGIRADMRRMDYDDAVAYPTFGVRWSF